ncbi:MAG: type I-MYXAN CRISPR-associated protein Cas5/Cmx5/DevS [Planctomycetaceae bacterium]|nr:type I-MYXAN CRISPR-associated protein Cas5/Cmx5/DevS [Planctomycetaceae bacterium]
MLCLYLQAPFAACRTFTAGWYRPTATFLTPSAAYGLMLNIAGIESRLYEHDPTHDGSAPATLMRSGLPAVRIALGVRKREPLDVPDDIALAASLPTVQTIYQQLHNYPVGTSGMPAELTKGTKNNITPVRREMLCNLRCYVCLDGDADLEERIRRGLQGEFNADRYGIPFLGDNQFLLDQLKIVESPKRPEPTYWYEAITDVSGSRPRPHTTRLTVSINRADMSQTDSRLFCPTSTPTATPPESAWVQVGQSVDQD